MEMNLIFYAERGLTDEQLNAMREMREEFEGNPDVAVETAPWVRDGEAVMFTVLLSSEGIRINVDGYTMPNEEEE